MLTLKLVKSNVSNMIPIRLYLWGEGGTGGACRGCCRGLKMAHGTAIRLGTKYLDVIGRALTGGEGGRQTGLNTYLPTVALSYALNTLTLFAPLY